MSDLEYIKEIGDKIVSIRKEKNLSSLELSFLCEMEKPNLIRIEKGRTNPTIKTLLKICKALQVDLKEIIP